MDAMGKFGRLSIFRGSDKAELSCSSYSKHPIITDNLVRADIDNDFACGRAMDFAAQLRAMERAPPGDC